MLDSKENHLDHMLGELKHEDERGKGRNFLKLLAEFYFNFYLSPHLCSSAIKQSTHRKTETVKSQTSKNY